MTVVGKSARGEPRLDGVVEVDAANFVAEGIRPLCNAAKRHDTYRRQRDLNIGGLLLLVGSGRPLRLRLTRREQISVRINDIA